MPNNLVEGEPWRLLFAVVFLTSSRAAGLPSNRIAKSPRQSPPISGTGTQNNQPKAPRFNPASRKPRETTAAPSHLSPIVPIAPPAIDKTAAPGKASHPIGQQSPQSSTAPAFRYLVRSPESTPALNRTSISAEISCASHKAGRHVEPIVCRISPHPGEGRLSGAPYSSSAGRKHLPRSPAPQHQLQAISFDHAHPADTSPHPQFPSSERPITVDFHPPPSSTPAIEHPHRFRPSRSSKQHWPPRRRRTRPPKTGFRTRRPAQKGPRPSRINSNATGCGRPFSPPTSGPPPNVARNPAPARRSAGSK